MKPFCVEVGARYDVTGHPRSRDDVSKQSSLPLATECSRGNGHVRANESDAGDLPAQPSDETTNYYLSLLHD